MSSIASGTRLSVNSAAPTAAARLVGQFWGLDSDRVFEFFLRQIVFSQEVDVPPGGRRPMGHRLQEFLALDWILDLDECLRQIQVIPGSVASGFLSHKNVERPLCKSAIRGLSQLSSYRALSQMQQNPPEAGGGGNRGWGGGVVGVVVGKKRKLFEQF
jgi:hypothetical protein